MVQTENLISIYLFLCKKKVSLQLLTQVFGIFWAPCVAVAGGASYCYLPFPPQLTASRPANYFHLIKAGGCSSWKPVEEEGSLWGGGDNIGCTNGAPSQSMLIATYSHFWCTCFLQNVTNPSIILCFFFSKEEAEKVASQSCRDKKRRSWPRATAYLPKSPVMNIISANLRIYGA